MNIIRVLFILELPGSPTAVSLCQINLPYNLQLGMKAQICWKTPQNIVDSTDPLVKSIQYDVTVCHFNLFSKEVSNCMLIATVPDNPNSQDQSTDVTKLTASPLYKYDIYLPVTRELLVVVQSVALNGAKGGIANNTIHRIDQHTGKFCLSYCSLCDVIQHVVGFVNINTDKIIHIFTITFKTNNISAQTLSVQTSE